MFSVYIPGRVYNATNKYHISISIRLGARGGGRGRTLYNGVFTCEPRQISMLAVASCLAAPFKERINSRNVSSRNFNSYYHTARSCSFSAASSAISMSGAGCCTPFVVATVAAAGTDSPDSAGFSADAAVLFPLSANDSFPASNLKVFGMRIMPF